MHYTLHSVCTCVYKSLFRCVCVCVWVCIFCLRYPDMIELDLFQLEHDFHYRVPYEVLVCLSVIVIVIVYLFRYQIISICIVWYEKINSTCCMKSSLARKLAISQASISLSLPFSFQQNNCSIRSDSLLFCCCRRRRLFS